ncbi:hypothetical protein OE88DRAFT_1663703 [Heliocybe sulcata]|uniref:L domain-like protein n=1 Tax=Heliocybe sulcata TaxID=5364 RepID=A0A5C3MXZ8_9AGAM|nr:hypothetical protein OE88DRAFT_1663703 [Heliocybe sulcata]
MATTRTIRRPAWQTEELAEEWVEPDDNASDAAPSVLSLGSPVGFGDDDREVEGNEEKREVERRPAGTFLVREDVPATPLLAKTPGHNKNAIKDFFTPLPLEQMFQPVSSPPVDSNYAYQPGATHHLDPLQRDESSASGSDTDGSEHRDSMAEHHPNHPPQCEFTFSVPRRSILSSSTPHPQGLLDLARRGLLPATDPRLRLFHFQYDTFTRDHLSQLVDSIAANTPSGSSGGEPSPAVNGTFARMATQLSRVSEASSSSSPSRLRSIKRIKLSPPTEYGDGDGAGAKFRRPRSRSRRDYNRESKSVMQQIKQARHFSKVFTRPDELSPLSGIIESQRDGVVAERSSQQAIPSVTTALLKVSKGNGGEQPPGGVDTNPQKSNPSFLDYRMQAVDLMAQIRTDVQEQGRLFSGDTMVSHVAAALSHSAARQSLSSSQRTALAQTQAHSKGSSAEQTEPVQIRSPARKDHLSSSTDARRSLKNRSPRKLCRVGSDGSLPGKPPFEVPAVAVFTAFPASNGANPAPFPISDGFLAPTHIAGYPSSSLRLRVSEDLNRLVSSSTASGTTLTAGSSAGSYSKHAGPPHMTRIAPEDMPALPDRVGKMVFDKELMKWVKDTAKATSFHADDPQARDQTSEDPFRDIESLKDEDSSRSRRSRRLSAQSQRTSEMSRITEVEESELEDEEERELASFSMGDHPSRVVPAMADGTDSEGEDEGYDEAIASGEESEEEVADVVEMSAAMSIDDLAPSSSILPQVVAPSAKPRVTPAKVHASPRGRKFTPYVFGTPVFPSRPSSSLAPTPLRSALKSGGATPNKTPANHPAWRRRSVSFSDGKREGQIRGLSKNSGTLSAPEADGSNAMSPRTRRIAKMMAQLEGTSYEEESPSKVTARPPAEEIQPFSLQATPANSTSASADGRNSSRSASVRSTKSFQKGNATFLTECSFGVAHDRLVQVITDVQPFEPHWEQLGAIDLSNKNLDSVARLKEFLPRLDSLCLDRNQVSYLSGIPSTVRSLSAASNVLTSVTSFNHLRNLENLDISGNDVDSLRQLECLRHLRELRADGNKVASVDGLEKLDGLVKLSLEGNAIGDVQLEKCRWYVTSS